MILGVRIRNFEALHDLTIGLSRGSLGRNAGGRRILTELNAVIGENSVGKSSLFRSLEFLSLSLREGLAEASTHGSNIGFTQLRSRQAKGDVVFDLIIYARELKSILTYFLEVAADKHGRPRISLEQVHAVKLSEDQCRNIEDNAILEGELPPLELFLDLKNGQGTVLQDGVKRTTQLVDRKRPGLATYGRLRDYPELCALYQFISSWYFCRFTDTMSDDWHRQLGEKNRLQLEAGNGEHHHLNEEGSNLANVMAYMKNSDADYYKRVVAEIKERMPHGGNLVERVRSGSLSGGELKLLSFFFLLADPEPRPLIMIENPDHGLYYNMIDELAKAMRDFVLQDGSSQIILSTHSQNLVESLAPGELWVMYRPTDDGESSGSHVINAEDLPLVKEFYEEGIGLSALWYSGHLDPID